MRYYLQCTKCGATFGSKDGVYKCSKCGGKLTIKYPELPHGFSVAQWVDTDKPGIWKFWRLLPIDNPDKGISLGEGGTFLHTCNKTAHKVGLSKLWVKDEGRNPTGSFKDRNAAVSVAKAVELGAKSVAIASDANAGPAVAAYAAKADLPCYVFMPVSTVPQRIAQAKAFGAFVGKIRSEGLVNDCITIVEELRKELGWHHLTTAGIVNPYQLESPKTIAYEIAWDLDGDMPDWIATPSGGGGLLIGIFKGLKELVQMGVIDHIPKLLCVQSQVCAPVVKAFHEHRPIEQWGKVAATIAVPIAVPMPSEGNEVLDALRVTNGAAITVSDSEILEAQSLLAREEGISASAAGASSLAGALGARGQGIIGPRETILTVVTGSGMKDLSERDLSNHDVPEFAANIEDVRNALLDKHLEPYSIRRR